MAGEEILGHGKIIVEVEENVRRELAEAEAAFDRTMAKLDRKEAEIKLGADTKELYAKFKKAQEDLERWEHQKATATLDVDQRQANAGIANAKRRLQGLEQSNVKFYNRMQQLEDDRAKAQEALVKRELLASKKVTKAKERELSRQTKSIAASMKKQQTDVEKAIKKGIDDYIKAEKAKSLAQEREETKRNKATSASIRKQTTDANKLIEKGLKDFDKLQKARTLAEGRETKRRMRISETEARSMNADIDNVASLTREYLKQRKKVADLTREKKKLFIGRGEREILNIDFKDAESKMNRLHRRLQEIGHPPPHIEFDVDEDGSNKLAKWASAITDTTIRLGPFTTSIGGAVRGLALLGPIVLGLVGSVGALASTLAMGLAGGLGLVASGALGLVPLLGAVALTTKSMLGQFTNAKQASDKLTKAQLTYGEGSKQAKKAQQELNSVLKNMDPAARQAFEGFTKLRTEWHKAVDDVAKRNIGKVMNDGIKTATALMPMFANRTKDTFGIVRREIGGWMQGLRSGQGQNVLNTLFTNANRALGPLMHGIGLLAGAFGKLMANFSKYLPGISKAFDDWAKGVNDAADNSGGMVKSMVGAFKDLVKFLGAAGKLLATIIGVGNGPGMNFIESMTAGMNKITDSINQDNGEGLRKFFTDSIDTTKQLFTIVVNIGKVFVEWATLLTPIVEIILKVLGAFTRIVSEAAKIGGVRTALTAGFAIFLTGTLIRRITEIIGALKALRAAAAAAGGTSFLSTILGKSANAISGGAFFGVKNLFAKGSKEATKEGVSAVEAAGSRLTRAMETAGEGAAGASIGSKAAAREVGLFRGAAEAAIPAIEGMGTIAGGAATAGLGLLAGAAVYGTYKLITMKSASDKLKDSLKDIDAATKNVNTTTKALADNSTASGQAVYNYGQSVGRVASLKAKLNKLEADGKKGTAEYKNTLNSLNQELQQREQNENQADKLYHKRLQLHRDRSAALAKEADAQGVANKADKDAAKWAKIAADEKGRDDYANKRAADSAKLAADAHNKLNAVKRAAAKADREAIVGELNYQRALHNLVPLAGTAATALARLNKRAPKLSQTISLQFADPKDAGAVARKASNALKAGVSGKIVTNIVANAKSAEDAIRKINKAVIRQKVLNIVQSGGELTLSMLQKITGHKLTTKQQHILEQGGEQAVAMLERILGFKLPPKKFRAWLETNAPGLLAQIRDGINSIPKSRTSTVTLNEVHNIITRHSGALPGVKQPNKVTPRKAAGRRPASQQEALVGEGRRPEWLYDRRTGRAVKTTGPAMTSLSPSEYVIPTEPRYRGRGKAMVTEIARDLGMPGYAAGAFAAKRPKTPAKSKGALPKQQALSSYDVGKGSFSGSKYSANLKVPDVSKKGTSFNFNSRSKKGIASDRRKTAHTLKAAVKVNNPWTRYVRGLLEQQSDLEREASIREAAVKEPDDFIKEIVDPATGDVKGYEYDQQAIKDYVTTLSPVVDVYKSLKGVTAELVQSVPLAIASLKEEIQARNYNIGILKREIAKEERKAKTKSKGGKTRDAKSKAEKHAAHIRDKAQSRLKKLRPALSKETGLRDDAKSAAEELNDETRKEAGFDFREFSAEYDTLYGELTGVITGTTPKSQLDTANQQLAWSDAGGGGGGAGGGADQPLSYSQQAAMADTEKAQILKDFGSNMRSPQAGGVSSVAGGGMQTNPAAISGARGLSDASGGGRGISSVAAALTPTASLAAPSFGGTSAPSAAPAAASSPGTTKNVTINNQFDAPPPDPTTWTKGVGFEAASVI